MAKMGRPTLGEKAKTLRYDLRMDENEYNELNDLSNKLNKNKSDIIREAIDLYKKILEANNV